MVATSKAFVSLHPLGSTLRSFWSRVSFQVHLFFSMFVVLLRFEKQKQPQRVSWMCARCRWQSKTHLTTKPSTVCFHLIGSSPKKITGNARTMWPCLLNCLTAALTAPFRCLTFRGPTVWLCEIKLCCSILSFIDLSLSRRTILYDEFVQTVLRTIDMLDLSYKVETGDEASGYVPHVPKDLQVHKCWYCCFDLTNLVKDICGTRQFFEWCSASNQSSAGRTVDSHTR